MTISSPEREAKKVKIAVDRNAVETSFEKWACDLKKGLDIVNYSLYNKTSQKKNSLIFFKVLDKSFLSSTLKKIIKNHFSKNVFC